MSRKPGKVPRSAPPTGRNHAGFNLAEDSHRLVEPVSGAKTGCSSSQVFALEYLANGNNATAAYRAAHPKCSQRTAEVNGSRLLRKAEVAAFIKHEMNGRVERLRMDADEALLGISNIARADVRRLFSSDGNILPMRLWPTDVADAVKDLRSTPFGLELKLHDRLKAYELMAIAAGMLKRPRSAAPPFDHAAFLGAEPPTGDGD